MSEEVPVNPHLHTSGKRCRSCIVAESLERLGQEMGFHQPLLSITSNHACYRAPLTSESQLMMPLATQQGRFYLGTAHPFSKGGLMSSSPDTTPPAFPYQLSLHSTSPFPLRPCSCRDCISPEAYCIPAALLGIAKIVQSLAGEQDRIQEMDWSVAQRSACEC